MNLRLGQFKSPVGLERMQAEQELEFVERGLSNNLVPFRDLGVMAYGSIVPDYLDYQVAYLNGANDLQVNTGDLDNNKDFAGRLLTYPLRWSEIEFLRGFGTAIAGTYGTHLGNPTAPNLTAGYLSMGQNKFFSYSTGAYASGVQWRVNPQAYFYKGPFGILGEYVINGQNVKNGAAERVLKNTGWIAKTSYVLTGEDASFDGVKPDSPFLVGKEGWGAFELAARAGGLHVDSDAFPLFSSSSASANRASEFAGGINWYLNNSVKINLNYAWTTFDGGNTGGRNREDEHVVLSRTQLRF
jgi:phosphate-selective porin OprO/OprP